MESASHHYYEKVFFGTANLLGAALAGMGAVLTDGDTRWLYVTLVVGILCSTSLALMTRKPTESIGVVAGRSLFAIIMTAVGTRLLAYWADLSVAHTDVIYLGGLSMLVNVLAYTVGYGLIRSLDDGKIGLGTRIVNIIVSILTKK